MKDSAPKFLLLDACIVIEAYKLGIWEKLIERVDISVSSIVAHKESLFFSKEQNKIPEPINLKLLIEKEKIKELEATPQEIAKFLDNFDSVFVAGLDPGEAESLALIMFGKFKDGFFCTGDIPAIQALAMIGHSEMGISLEALLKSIGLQQKLRTQFTEKFFKDQINTGSTKLLFREGLKR